MKILLALLAMILLSNSTVFAQETPEVTDWKMEQRCITAPSQPADSWTYDGVIFTFKSGDGIHARRADVATPYYLALDSEGEFGSIGSFSPDGKWFAVPAGRIYPDYTGFQNSYLRDDFAVDQIRVYSTTPAHMLYVMNVQYEGMGWRPTASPDWIDNQTLVFSENANIWGMGSTILVFNPFSGNSVTVSDYPTIPSSADGTRAVKLHVEGESFNQKLSYTLALIDDFSAAEVNLPIVWSDNNLLSVGASPVRWTADSAHFAALLNAEQVQVGIFDRNGKLSDTVPLKGRIDDFKYSSDGERLAFVQTEGSIQIADLATHTIIDTCIETPYAVAFSPDGKQLAFGLEPAGYTYVLDLAAWQAYRIDLAAADVVGWYPVS